MSCSPVGLAPEWTSAQDAGGEQTLFALMSVQTEAGKGSWHKAQSQEEGTAGEWAVPQSPDRDKEVHMGGASHLSTTY